MNEINKGRSLFHSEEDRVASVAVGMFLGKAHGLRRLYAAAANRMRAKERRAVILYARIQEEVIH